MASQPISIHYKQMEEWLEDRKPVLFQRHKRDYNELMSIAPRLRQMAQYDIPTLEKQMRKHETAVDECHRVCEEALRTQQKLRERRGALLREYGIDFAAAHEESDVAAALHRRVMAACAQVNNALQEYARARLRVLKEYYNSFLARTADGFYGADPFAFHFPWLERALTEAEYQPADSSHEATGAGVEDVDAAVPQIDWGDDGDGAAGSAMAAVQIKWDATEVGARPEEDDTLPAADGRHFSIDLASTRHRVNVMAELEAASCFCRERSTADLLECSAATEAMHSFLLNSKEGELVRMKQSYRAMDSFVDRLNRFGQQILAAKNRSASHQTKMRDAHDELRKLQNQHEALVSHLRSARDDALTHLRCMFPERNILIVGDLNRYLT
ncbi:hypothetical protein LSCM1_03988 [Leishmania martiniquensis]|uniref:Uncharacterized protein n=1 Tax=Leishmania martiniquensis TaxID=1580590 RepID=A0A836KNS2_9TRYP|nr:hypothetical protein LSCM1_03988 [Leishmania martiniquensis]